MEDLLGISSCRKLVFSPPSWLHLRSLPAPHLKHFPSSQMKWPIVYNRTEIGQIRIYRTDHVLQIIEPPESNAMTPECTEMTGI